MAAKEGVSEGEEFVYRISTAAEWEELQTKGSTLGREIDKSTGCFHLCKLDQVRPVLQNFFANVKEELYLLQIDAKKLGDGLIYELADGNNKFTDGNNRFPHFYGPSRSFCPFPSDVVTKAEKLSLSGGQYSCIMLN
ncbi:hypothetical protein SLEP1_g48194 [Rubroshorea leprosula]|uniref:Uncharacterized protein n=1 Tax=Rubroshorea leprosula TaxID=152421 RepID=A0AAV5LSV4_9ROSI|nr:hypothetical protein SLEP1_g48194 [Rubroshorea leprosula]